MPSCFRCRRPRRVEPAIDPVERLREELRGVPDGVEITTGTFVNEQGLKLQTYRFSPASSSPPDSKHADAKGIVWLCHGYGAHTCFEWFLPEEPGAPHNVWTGSIPGGLVDAGYVVCTLDQQGHGRSEGARGLRCYFGHFDDLARENLLCLATDVLTEPGLKNLPLFVFGISMGGATAVRMVQLRPNMFRGAILYAPMLSLELVKKQRIVLCITNGHIVPIASGLDMVIPRYPLLKPATNRIHPETSREFEGDPLNYHGNVRVHVAKAFSDLADWFVGGGLSEVQTPFVTFHSVKDTFTDPFGSERLFELSPCKDKVYRRVGKGLDVDVDIWHMLATEPGHEKIFASALSWIRERSVPYIPN